MAIDNAQTIKLIVCDLDGTMLADKVTMRRDVKMTIRQLQARSILFVPATGRHLQMCPWFQNCEIKTDYLIANNGSVLARLHPVSLEYQPIAELFFSFELSEQFLVKTAALGLEACCITNQHDYIVGNRVFFAYGNRWASNVTLHRDRITKTLTKHSKIYQWVLRSAPADIDQTVAFIKQLTICQIYVHSRHRRWNLIEINPHQSDKWRMVQKICELEKINDQEIMAIGNGENDMKMIKRATVGVCPSTTPSHVLAWADIIFTWNFSQGLVKFLTSYFNGDAATRPHPVKKCDLLTK